MWFCEAEIPDEIAMFYNSIKTKLNNIKTGVFYMSIKNNKNEHIKKGPFLIRFLDKQKMNKENNLNMTFICSGDFFVTHLEPAERFMAGNSHV